MLVPRQPIENPQQLLLAGCSCYQLQVRVALYKDGEEVHSLKFNAVNDNVAWFTKENLNFATWDDLINSSHLQQFALQPADAISNRSFEISKKYTSCEEDEGWLMISTDTNPCHFEKKNPLSILYSRKKSFSVYNSMGESDKSQFCK